MVKQDKIICEGIRILPKELQFIIFDYWTSKVKYRHFRKIHTRIKKLQQMTFYEHYRTKTLYYETHMVIRCHIDIKEILWFIQKGYKNNNNRWITEWFDHISNIDFNGHKLVYEDGINKHCRYKNEDIILFENNEGVLVGLDDDWSSSSSDSLDYGEDMFVMFNNLS